MHYARWRQFRIRRHTRTYFHKRCIIIVTTPLHLLKSEFDTETLFTFNKEIAAY